LLALVLVSGFFEAVFFRGFLQLRFDKALGIIPGILIASVMYSLYHVGYPGWATPENLVTLFAVGVLYAGVFRTTKGILNQWPVFIQMGAMLDVYARHGTIVRWPEAYGYLTIGLAYLVFFAYAFGKKTLSDPRLCSR
jgi:membrane protease YdiL (CAAX protease family)